MDTKTRHATPGAAGPTVLASAEELRGGLSVHVRRLPRGCSPSKPHPRCRELSEASRWAACTEVDDSGLEGDDETMGRGTGRALTVAVTIAAYSVKTLRVSC